MVDFIVYKLVQTKRNGLERKFFNVISGKTPKGAFNNSARGGLYTSGKYIIFKKLKNGKASKKGVPITF